jgi:hypothetical protein
MSGDRAGANNVIKVVEVKLAASLVGVYCHCGRIGGGGGQASALRDLEEHIAHLKTKRSWSLAYSRKSGRNCLTLRMMSSLILFLTPYSSRVHFRDLAGRPACQR